MNVKCVAWVAGSLLLVLGGLSSCSTTSPSDAGVPEGGSSDTVLSQDPQVFSDVIAGVFVLSSNHARSVRVNNGVSNLWQVACGGEPVNDLSSTDVRYNQARYADLDLIAEKGLVEHSEPVVGAVNLLECEQDVLPSVEEWFELREPWNDAMRSAAESDPVSETKPEVAACLERESGLEVEVTDPTASFLGATDYFLATADDWDAGMARLSEVFVACTGRYFEAMEAELQVAQDELVERNRELLERFAQEISAAGYVP